MGFIITIVFLAAMLLIGIVKRRNTGSVAGFFVSGRSGSVLRITGSLVATIIGGSATLGLAGLGFTTGLPAVWWLLSGSVCLVILGTFFAARVRRYGVYSMPEILEVQYNSGALRVISSLVILVAWLGVIAAQITAAGRIAGILWPGHFVIPVILCGSIFIIYTAAGGQNSVIRTEVFQAILIFTGIGLLFIMLVAGTGDITLLKLPGGFLDFPVNSGFTYYDILGYFLFVGTSYLAGPDMYSRILSAKDEATAKRAVFITAILISVIAFAIVLIGIYGKGLYPEIEAESVFPRLIVDVLPAWIQGVVVASLLAAFLSSADTCLITSSVILNSDIINPLIFKNRLDDKKQVYLTRIIIIILGVISIIITLYMGGIIKSMLFALTVYTTGLIVPVIFGFYREKLRLNSYGAIAAVAAGSCAALAMEFFSLNMYLIFIFPAVIIVLFAVSYIKPE